MMRDYADEANLHARIYAMKGRLLSPADYAFLARRPNEAQRDQPANPAAAQEAVFKEQIAPVMPLVEAAGQYTPLFLAFLRQFEALNAKLILAKAFGLAALEQWYDIGPYALLERRLLDDEVDLQAIRPLLTGSYLADVLDGAVSFEQMEIRVDLCTARNLYVSAALFGKTAKRDFEELIGRRLAVTFIILTLRMKKTYLRDGLKISAFLESFFGPFYGLILSQMKAAERILDMYLAQSRTSGAQEPSAADCEHYLEQQYYNWISNAFHRDFHSISCVVAYLWLLYCQIRNLFKIIEGRRFGFPPERILARLVCSP